MAQYVGLFPSKARTASENSIIVTNYEGARGLVAVINVTAASSPSIVFTIQGYDSASDSYYDILASAAITGTGATVLRVDPDLTAATNTVAKDLLPRFWRVKAVAGNGNSATYSVGAQMI